MKKHVILLFVCICACSAIYTLYKINSNVSSLSDKKIISICKNVASDEAKNDDSISLRRQRDIEEICICGAKKMPHSVTLREFKQILKNNDSRATEIFNDCIEELIIKGVISEEDA